jgi:hypothetical protein
MTLRFWSLNRRGGFIHFDGFPDCATTFEVRFSVDRNAINAIKIIKTAPDF